MEVRLIVLLIFIYLHIFMYLFMYLFITYFELSTNFISNILADFRGGPGGMGAQDGGYHRMQNDSAMRMINHNLGYRGQDKGRQNQYVFFLFYYDIIYLSIYLYIINNIIIYDIYTLFFVCFFH
jgi:hypothetical protein